MKNINKLFAILHKWKPHYVLAAFLLLLSTLFRMLEPKILQITVDGIIVFFQSENPTQPHSNDSVAQWFYNILPELKIDNLGYILFCIALIYIAISLIRGLTMFASSAITAFSTEKAIKRLRDKLFLHIQHLPLSFHSTLSTGEMIQRCSGDVDTIRNFIGNQVVEIIRVVAIFSLSFAMIATVSWTYAFIAVAIAPVILILSVVFFKKESQVWEKHEAEQDKLTSIVEENLAGIRVVKAFAKEDFEIEKFDKQNSAKYDIGITHLKLHALYWPISDALFHLQISMSLFFGGYFALNGMITVGEMIGCYTYIIMVSWPMRRIGQIISKMSMAMVAIDRLSQILDEEEEDYSGFDNDNKPFIGDVEFRNVWFKYSDTEDFVLRAISFKVDAGEKVALLGATGSGKSTLMALLVRFYEPTKGDIFIDGINIKELSKDYLRKRIGVVLQKPFLFSTTIKNNIAYTRPHIEDEEIVEVSKSASIHHIMHVFSDGYDTIVGEKGVTLSGGQKQRVALARTLLEKPDILVLDDATSAVDTETEFDIQNALQEHLGNKTTFIIAHRMTSIQHATKIIVLEKGEIVEEGTHTDLVINGGFYQKVYEVQAAIEADW